MPHSDLEEFKKFVENAEELTVVVTKQKSPVSRKNTSEAVGEKRQQLKMYDENKKSVETPDVVSNNSQAAENSFDEPDQAKSKTVKQRKSKKSKVIQMEKAEKIMNSKLHVVNNKVRKASEEMPTKREKQRVSAPARIKAKQKKVDNKVRLLAPYFGYFRGKLVCLILKLAFEYYLFVESFLGYKCLKFCLF